MCVAEALACGTPVIAPPVGWVSEFPHLEYETGNADDLRRVLEQVVAEKMKLRESVLHKTWDAWADGHDRLFSALLRQAGKSPGRYEGGERPAQPHSVQLVLHGTEIASLGGPSVRVPRTARVLREQGISAELVRFPNQKFGSADVIHGFNVWSAKTSLAMAKRAHALRKPFVFSPIFLDLSDRQFWQEDLPAVFDRATDVAAIDTALAELNERHALEIDGSSPAEAFLGYHAMTRAAVACADHVIFLSEHEKALLEQINIRPRASTIVRNPVDVTEFDAVDPELFKSFTGIKDYVLCVARIEPRKNQLLLIQALRNTGIDIVLVGHVSQKSYGELVHKFSGPNVHFIDRLEPGSEMLRSAFAGARVVALPSWTEGAPLVALEGAAAGASLVLSDRSGEKEYFADKARYFDPAKPELIRLAVLEAYESEWLQADRDGLKQHVSENFNWARHAQATLEVYKKAFTSASERYEKEDAARIPTAVEGPIPVRDIVFDVTTSANHRGRWTGIARVEMEIALALNDYPDIAVHFVAWADVSRRFVAVPLTALQPDFLSHFVESAGEQENQNFKFAAGAVFMVGGSAWMQNSRYSEAVTNFAAERQLLLTTILHDLIPVHFPFWFNDGYAPTFERNLSLLLSASWRVLAVSENTRRDIEGFATNRNLYIPPVQVFREGDSLRPTDLAVTEDDEKLAEIKGKIGSSAFVLSVGAIHVRKNHKLLYDIWVRLKDALGDRCPHLIIVGGVAWNGEEVARAIRTDAKINKIIHIVENVEDNVLCWLYAHCRFTLYPSLYEGWGLPVGESLRFGKICIASKTSSVVEIAPDLTDLIDPLDFKLWYTRVLYYASSEVARVQRETEITDGYRATTWAESARGIIELLSTEIKAWDAPNLYDVGTLIKFDELESAVLFKTLSWHPTERWGVWSSGLRAGVRLALRERPPAPLTLIVRARALVASGSNVRCNVTINGQAVGRMIFTSGAMRTFSFWIPLDLLPTDQNLEIVFENDRIELVQNLIPGSKDQRRIGIGVEFVALVDASNKNGLTTYLDFKEKADAVQFVGQKVPVLLRMPSSQILQGEWKPSGWGMVGTVAKSSLHVTLHEDPGTDAILNFTVRGVATKTKTQRVLVIVNGTQVGDWIFADDSVCEREVKVPADVRNKQQPMVVEFHASGTRSPAALRIGAESRTFGFGLFELQYGTKRLLDLARSFQPVSGAPYNLGQTINFHLGNSDPEDVSAAAYLVRGWFPAEEEGSWTSGNCGSLRLRLPSKVDSSLILEMELRPFGTAMLGAADVRILVNGFVVLSRTVTSSEMRLFVCGIPEIARDGRNVLNIDVMTSRSGSGFSLRTNDDDRLIGIQVSKARVRRSTAFEVGEPIYLNDADVVKSLLADDWHEPESAGVWSNGKLGSLYLAIPDGLRLPDSSESAPPNARARSRQGRPLLQLLALARVAHASVAEPVTVKVMIGGRLSGEHRFDSVEFALLAIPIPSDLLVPGGLLNVEFEHSNPRSPSALGLGADDRVLGVYLSGLAIVRTDKMEESVRRMAGAGVAPHSAFQPLLRAPYNVGTTISFRAGSGPDEVSAAAFLDRGWFPAEDDGRWTDGDCGRLRLRLIPKVRGSLILDIALRPFATAVLGPAAVRVFVNGFEVLSKALDKEAMVDFVCVIPDEICGGEESLTIEVMTNQVESGVGLKINNDDRRLGVQVGKIRLRQPTTIPVGEPIGLARANAVQSLVAHNWHEPESDGIWSSGKLGVMYLGAPDGAGVPAVPNSILNGSGVGPHKGRSPFQLFAIARVSHASVADPVAVKVLVNGQVCGEHRYDSVEFALLAIPVPDDLVVPGGLLEIAFEHPNPTSPKELGLSDDARVLGVFLASMAIAQVDNAEQTVARMIGIENVRRSLRAETTQATAEVSEASRAHEANLVGP